VSFEYSILSVLSMAMKEIIQFAGVYIPGDTLHTVKWSNFVGGATPEQKGAFSHTIVADCLIRPGKQDTPPDEAAWIEQYRKSVDRACINRQLFTTRLGKFGTGLRNLKRSENVAIFLGGNTPFVLRRCSPGKKRRCISELCVSGDAYKLIGEARVDGMMYYEGNTEERIKNGEVKLLPDHLS
jgi:hypothetical protein